MTFDINSFKSTGLKWGGARPSLFVVEFTPPGTIGTTTGLNGVTYMSRMTCKAASLPESTVAEIEVGYFGRKVKVSGERAFQDWQLNVMNDENFVIRSLLESWSNAINRMEANIRDTAYDQEAYKTDMVVRQFSKIGDEIRSYTIYGAWPTQVGQIALDWDQGNAIEYFPVAIAYDYWAPTNELTTDGAVTYGPSVTIRNNAPAN
jgi:hypothetical protein